MLKKINMQENPIVARIPPRPHWGSLQHLPDSSWWGGVLVTHSWPLKPRALALSASPYTAALPCNCNMDLPLFILQNKP